MQFEREQEMLKQEQIQRQREKDKLFQPTSKGDKENLKKYVAEQILSKVDNQIEIDINDEDIN